MIQSENNQNNDKSWIGTHVNLIKCSHPYQMDKSNANKKNNEHFASQQ